MLSGELHSSMGSLVVTSQAAKSDLRSGSNSAGSNAGNGGVASISLGILGAGLFYGVAYVFPWPPIQRYFLGHPVAVAATVLFSVALATLATKWFATAAQWRFMTGLRDSDLLPPHAFADATGSPAETFKRKNDVRHVATTWLASLDQLPALTRRSKLLNRLREALERQQRRGTSKHLADDLRELSVRDADAAHDSFGLIRIIVWAIPMLGFLGTVIGITQTLGGLDFTDGTAAVDRLKSGLYVAFDTTALGLVLSVVAIFLQFPVERNETNLMTAIDDRVGPLLSGALPHDDQRDDPTQTIVRLCDGIRTAVAESLASQTTLWRQTIDEANEHWKTVHESDANRFAQAVDASLVPALHQHAGALDESVRFAGDRLERNANEWQGALESSFDRLLVGHQATLQGQTKLTTLQQQLIDSSQSLTKIHSESETLQVVQATLQANLQTLAETHRSINTSVQSATDNGLPDAMRTLARAVEMLSTQLTARDEPSSDAAPMLKRAA